MKPDQLIQEIIQISNKPKNIRSQTDLLIMKQYCQNLRFYKQYDQKTIDIINQHIQIELIPQNRVLFKIYTYGSQFYVVLKGSVKVLVDDNQLKLKRVEYNGEVVEDLKSYEKIQKVKYVAELGVGFSFGELALMNNQKRQATIITSTDCVFGVLNKQDYKTILLNHEKIKLKKVLDDVIGVKVFQNLEIKHLKKICQVMLIEETHKWNQDVYTFGNQPMSVYIIIEGEYSVYQKWNDHLDPEDHHYKSFKRINTNLQNYKCAILTGNQIFGYEEILAGQTKRHYNVKCTSQYGRIYKIDKSLFLKDIYSVKNVQKYFDTIQENKTVHRNMRMQQFTRSKSNTNLKTNNYQTIKNTDPPSELKTTKIDKRVNSPDKKDNSPDKKDNSPDKVSQESVCNEHRVCQRMYRCQSDCKSMKRGKRVLDKQDRSESKQMKRWNQIRSESKTQDRHSRSHDGLSK